MQTYRQGDVLLVKLDSLPQDAKVTQKKGAVILALGEATGHKHQIKTGVIAYEWKGNMLIEVKKGTALTHEEHDAIALVPGVYQRIIQREYSPLSIREVKD